MTDKDLETLNSCHKDLIRLITEMDKIIPLKVLCGYRGEDEQNKAFNEGKSKLKYPEGKHNKSPAEAVDVAPMPLDWNNAARFYYFGGFVKAMAQFLKINIRWGGDWNQNNDPNDDKFRDLVHFELI